MMSETDWREILSFSQKELLQADKDKLCESLSWMEANDIELNFTDLKTLFRLAQDILKYKSEQVDNLRGQHETMQRKLHKSKAKHTYTDSPVRSSDSLLETITQQEEVIKANKEVLKQLYENIAELEEKKMKLIDDKDNVDKDSESSREPLSELNEVLQLENEITVKNRHIRKLLSDVKVLEEENTTLKEKLTVVKDKLTEATQLIENLTEQLFTINKESALLKDALGKSEERNAHLCLVIESLKKELINKETNKESTYGEIKSKVLHWKNIVKQKRAEVESLLKENKQLKENIVHGSSFEPLSNEKHAEECKIKELHEKLLQASSQIERSADIIEKLKTENRYLKSIPDEPSEYQVNENRNISDENKEKIIMNKMKKKIKNLVIALQDAEEMINIRDKELAEITSQLQLVKSDEGIKSLLDGIKTKKRQLKSRDQGIKSLVQEVNSLNELVDSLQIQNEALRQRFNIPRDDEIPTKGVLKKFLDIEEKYQSIDKTLKRCESNLIASDVNNHILHTKCNKLTDLLIEMGCSKTLIDEINHEAENYNQTAVDKELDKTHNTESSSEDKNGKKCNCEFEMQTFIDENEGLRKGLQEILNYLKDNSTSSSGVLSLQCPSLDAVLQSMEARHLAGWFAPHMSTVMELRSALGGRDALLTALHEARKETFEVMTKFTEECKKSTELEKKLQHAALQHEVETKNTSEQNCNNKEQKSPASNAGEFGSWMLFDENKIDLGSGSINDIENQIAKRNSSYEDYLKKGLSYFHEKFKTLFEKMTTIIVQTADQQNQWSIQEEQYKAQIESLRMQLSQKEEEDISEDSPGLVVIPSSSSLHRKCLYLEESYKYIRTLNENMKNEILEYKKDSMIMSLEFESQIQNLMLIIANLFDRLCCSISIEIFWKQNAALNETVKNYRKILHEYQTKNADISLLDYFTNQKSEIISIIRNCLQESNDKSDEDNLKIILSQIEQSLIQEQMKTIFNELGEKNNKIKLLEAKNIELQEAQALIIDESLTADTKEEMSFIKSQLKKLAEENKILKEQYQHVENQLHVALLQLRDTQQRQISDDIEINMLRHQILDLQSTSDNKAIISRLSGEVLVAHLIASENQKKIERLNTSLNKEKQSKIEAEEMLKARQNIFDLYIKRYESKFKYMYEVMQVLRRQYHGCLPLASLENYFNKIEEFTRKSNAANEKLEEIEDLQYRLMTKHSVYEQVLDLSKNKCLEEQDGCPHKLKNIVLEKTYSRDESHFTEKIQVLEKSREDLRSYCNKLENTIILLNQGFEKQSFNATIKKFVDHKDQPLALEIEDIHSDDESDSRKSRTITIHNPRILKPAEKPNIVVDIKEEIPETSKVLKEKKNKTKHVSVQTALKLELRSISTQTDVEQNTCSFQNEISRLKTENEKIKNDMTIVKISDSEKSERLINLNNQKIRLESRLENLQDSIAEKDRSNELLRTAIEDLNRQCENLKHYQMMENNKLRIAVDEENKSLLIALKQAENDKNSIALEYKELLDNEREEYAKATKELNMKIMDLQFKLDSKENDSVASKADAVKEVISKYTLKLTSLEDECFKSQSELDTCRTERATFQSELERWKDLAIERLAKMEQLNNQLEKRHCHEVDSYKAENQHWMMQLNETQREHLELRSRLSEQKAVYMKQMADKDAVIEQLRSAINALKTQIISMQTMISVNDPSFDLSAIVEVDESSDALSQHGSDRLELKFDSTVDIHETQDDLLRIPSTSTTIWQEPVIDRLRREKQLMGKQNATLRRQIKALAARERRARLDAQNLKNQLFRISTSGNKVGPMETATLQNKIASLQTQLSSARRDNQSSVALWDKWKRAQHNAERWQGRYEEKCQDVKKMEMSLNLAKSAILRLEKEKRLLLSRISEVRYEKQLTIEKQDAEVPEKSSRLNESERSPPVSARALLDRVQAQQRRIVALEVAEKGNEFLVSEYEKALANITSLKGQVLKLESTLLESQIRTPLQTTQDSQSELDYWKSYCEMLKEENVQLNLRVSSLDTTPNTATAHRVNDLEQTVLTLRGLVSKLQAEQKSSVVLRRGDSRPNSGRSASDKTNLKQLDTQRTEIANLKRSIQDKDLLLERSKEMLKIAAEREDELLRENEFLRRRLEELTISKGGFLSA